LFHVKTICSFCLWNTEKLCVLAKILYTQFTPPLLNLDTNRPNNYQPTPRRFKKESHKPEARVDLPYFHGKKNVEIYLDWEMKVEQLFTCHDVSEKKKSIVPTR